MGIARHFNAGLSGGAGVHTEYLNSGISAETYTAFTCTAWVKRDYTGTRNGIMGRMFNFHDGWCLFVDENSKLNFYAFTGSEVLTTSPEAMDLSDWMFVAATYDGSNVRLYAGNTSYNLNLLTTNAMTGNIGEIGVISIMCGNVAFGGLFTASGGSAIIGWNGSGDQFGIWSKALSEDELKDAMTCATRVAPANIKLICDVDGITPVETAYTVGGNIDANGFTVDGTEVIEGEYVGCDYVPEGDRYASGRPKFLLYLSADTSVIIPPDEEDAVITKFPLRHFTMPEFSALVTPLLGLRGPYILASDNTQHSRIFAIDHTYKSDNGDAIRVEIESGNITHGTMNQKRCEYYRFYVKRVDGGSFTLFVNDENQGFDAGETVSLDPNENTEYVVTEVRNVGVYRNRRIKLVHSSDTDDFELVWMEEGFTVLGR